MRVTNIAFHKEKSHTIYHADFIFDRPFGGRKDRLRFWILWSMRLLLHPLQTLKFGQTVRQQIWYRIPNAYAPAQVPNDAFFLLALPLAVATNEDLFFDGSVAKELLNKVKDIHEYYHEIKQRIVQVQTTGTHPLQKANQHSGQFFTLGVDSFYTLDRVSKTVDMHRHKLVYVEGYDMPFYEKKFFQQVRRAINTVARSVHSQPIYIETNLRSITDKVVGWGRYHVSALVAVSTLLGFKKTLISGESFEALDWGLRLGSDKLYSTKNQALQLVAHNMSRIDKMQQLITAPIGKLFVRFVRVCWENARMKQVPYNCSVCQKCLKTKLMLLGLNVKHTPSLQTPKSETIERLQLVEHVAPEWHKLLKLLQKNPTIDPAYLTAIDKVLQKPLRR